MTETSYGLGSPETRRSVLQKGALAAGALALGGTAGVGTIAAQEDSGQVAVNAFRFYPGADFDVIAQLQTETTVEVLQFDDEPVSELSRPDEWSGHIIRYGIGEEAGITTLLFARNRRMSVGDSGTLGVDASTLSRELNLLNVSIDGSSGSDTRVDEDEDGESNDDDESDGGD